MDSSLWTPGVDILVSIPRGDLLALQAATIENHKKCDLHFKCQVTGANTREGNITYTSSKRSRFAQGFDLIAFADGVNGIGQNEAKAHGTDTSSETIDIAYLTTTIGKEAAIKEHLELTKIHFFPCEHSLGIGLPNYDGTISLLIEGKIRQSNNKKVCPFTGKSPFKFNRVVFDAHGDAKKYLEGQNPKLARVLPVDEILNKRPERFIQAFVSDWRVQELGVLLGDAGSCAPPWAGFGMNLACSHAEDLARLVCESNDLGTALEQYNHRRLKCTEVTKRIISDHGELLGSGMGTKQWRRDQTLRDRREQVFGERTDYQSVAFEERGLETLAKLE